MTEYLLERMIQYLMIFFTNEYITYAISLVTSYNVRYYTI